MGSDVSPEPGSEAGPESGFLIGGRSFPAGPIITLGACPSLSSSLRSTDPVGSGCQLDSNVCQCSE